jgi:hypothetical protein
MTRSFFRDSPECAVRNILTGAAIFFVCAFFLSCAEETALDALFGVSAVPPVYEGHQVLSGKQINFTFSTDVTVRHARFQPDIPVEETVNGRTISVIFAEERAGGAKITADVLVEDHDGNTLNILVPFRTRNERVPELVINEIRFDYSKPKSEYIELKTKTAGNLGALRLFAVSASVKDPIYEFPPVEVDAGEYILLHLRTLPTDNGVDELETALNLAASGAPNDVPADARDLWVPANKKTVHKTDVIYLVDQDDTILDGLALCEEAAVWDKNKTLYSKAAELLAKQHQWLSKDGIAIKSPSAEDAVSGKKTTTTRTLCRDETIDDSNTAPDWYICDTSKCSPGKQNSTVRYNEG